jgi:anaerobic selenocysteine-containing dehydrogenase
MRMSQTGANADEWIACPPGLERAFALSLAHVILDEKLRPANGGGSAAAAIDGWSTGLSDYAPEKLAPAAGMDPARLRRIAREAAASSPAVALIGDLATAQTNGIAAAVAVNALNALLGSVGKPGGIEFAPAAANASASASASARVTIRDLVQQINAGSGPKVLLIYRANPVFATPTAWQVSDTLGKVPFIASLGSFVDETGVLADLILPDHSPLESWTDDVPSSGSTKSVASVAPPVMSPLHDTKSMPDVLIAVAQQLGGDAAKALPYKTYQDALKASFAQYQKAKSGSVTGTDADDFWKKVQAAGGWWSIGSEAAAIKAGVKAGNGSATPMSVVAQFDGDPSQYPFHFLPFPSQMFYDGSLAHLPWMQEAPDPMSSAMWSTWIEINPQTAQQLGIAQADLIEVTSQHGALRAPAMLTPGIAPNALAMPIGQGHTHYTRYANNRGANPFSIVAPMTAENGALAWGATRVKISNVGKGRLVLFGGSLSEVGEQPR